MTYSDLSSQIKKTDSLIASFEDEVVSRVESAMDRSFKALEKEFRRRWIEGESKDLAGKDRAILILGQISNYLSLMPSDESEVELMYEKLVEDAAAAGHDFAAAAIDAISGGSDGFTVAKTTNINIKAVAYQAQDAAKRLYRHDGDFVLRASKIIEQGLVQGSGVAKVASQLRQQMGVTAAKAETIARTESMAAMDSATRDTYQKNGINYVQRIGTQDKDICSFCAARIGNVYEVSKAPATLHPRDRCYNAPWKREWAELGLVDESWLTKHQSGVMALLADQGKQPDYGLAPFERLSGMLSPPSPEWKIGDSIAAPAN